MSELDKPLLEVGRARLAEREAEKKQVSFGEEEKRDSDSVRSDSSHWVKVREYLDVQRLMDGMGRAQLHVVTVDELKFRFFSLGLQVGLCSSQRLFNEKQQRPGQGAWLAPSSGFASPDQNPLRQVGGGICMFFMSIIIMLSAYDGSTLPILELSAVYYCLFRALFLLCFFFSCHGALIAFSTILQTSSGTTLAPCTHIFPDVIVTQGSICFCGSGTTLTTGSSSVRSTASVDPA